MLILNSLLVHLLWLGSIFIIYFRSPVISGLQPQNSLPLEAPAKRLVLIVTDGLRSESFFHDNCSDIPSIRSLFVEQGLVGVSHTRVPTESRPGHIALIAGLYEDPSAVTRGWKENPIDFDTLFNRSAKTYAWGANDILHIFTRLTNAEQRLFIDAYDHELDFSGRDKTYELDEWVFEHVQLFINRKKAELQKEEQVVFFLHLLGLDSAGHIHKPGSTMFLENLHRTDRGIKRVYEAFEETFPDGRTAYILTSDHGMTNAGAHGSGDPLETETPFFIWGAGIANEVAGYEKTFVAGAHNIRPLYGMEQAQVAPLMASLLGVPPPMNNFGILPSHFLNVSDEYKVHVVHSNVLQLLEQYKKLLSEHQKGYFSAYLRSFDKLTMEHINAYMHSIQKYLKLQDYITSIAISYKIMDDTLEGIDYYHGYYCNILLISTTITFLIWIVYLLQLVLERGDNVRFSIRKSLFLSLIFIQSLLLFVLMNIQNVPFAVAFYLTIPILMLLLLLRNSFSYYRHKLYSVPLIPFALIILCAELLVCAFFERQLISLGFLLFALVNNYRTFATKDLKFFFWIVLIIVLAIFPLFPPSIGYKNTIILYIGMSVTILRPLFTKSHLTLRDKLFSAIILVNAVLCTYQHANQIGISLVSQIISWLYLFYSIISVVVNPVSVLKQRVELIFFNFTSLYNLLCTSFESIFVLMLASELMLSLSQHQQLQIPSQIDKANNSKQLQASFRLAFVILLYTFFSFFGTGNIVSVSSFDPNIIRCFLTTFSPFIIMALVILKLIIPVLLNISIIFGLSPFARANEKQIFICLLLICDIMGLNFLFLVKNRGSWLEIGSSISHFVIMEITTLVLLALTFAAKVLLRLDTSKFIAFKLK